VNPTGLGTGLAAQLPARPPAGEDPVLGAGAPNLRRSLQQRRLQPWPVKMLRGLNPFPYK